jgi:hypothetical protein
MKIVITALFGILLVATLLNPRFLQRSIPDRPLVRAHGIFERRVGTGFVYQFFVDGTAKRFSCTFCPFYRLPKEGDLLLDSAGSRLLSITLPDGTVINDQTGKARRIRCFALATVFLGFLFVGKLLKLKV